MQCSMMLNDDLRRLSCTRQYCNIGMGQRDTGPCMQVLLTKHGDWNFYSLSTYLRSSQLNQGRRLCGLGQMTNYGSLEVNTERESRAMTPGFESVRTTTSLSKHVKKKKIILCLTTQGCMCWFDIARSLPPL